MRWTRQLITGCAGAFVLSVCAATSPGAVVIEFDAAAAGAGVLPQDGVPPWTFGGNNAAVNNGTFLDMNNAANHFSEWDSPAVPGTMVQGVTDYTVEWRMRPTVDLPATDWFANLKVMWRDDTHRYDVTIDLDADDGGLGTTGSLRYKQGFTGSLSEAITGIDWSVPRTIAVAYRASSNDFEFFLDGVSQGVLSQATFHNGTSAAGVQDKTRFGDGTNNQGPSAAEWYWVRVHDVALPEPGTLGILTVAGLTLLPRRRSS